MQMVDRGAPALAITQVPRLVACHTAAPPVRTASAISHRQKRKTSIR